MDRWTDGWIDGWMGGWENRWVGEGWDLWVDGEMNE